MPFERNIQVYTFFMIRYETRNLLGKQWRQYKTQGTQKLELQLKFCGKTSMVKTDVVYLLILITSIIQKEV